ncbi:hypothetical protein SAMN06269185_3314 [Natronoarchaeum philippinense]|uniref:Uncharacterized protein n=1 Tax=Natronoarchaeum philippinense TaxID=558529 RepID=A0A285PAI8_NATPI|nr:hypothetical protein [Natronoarchaeum philippinense]SNZ18267.1 hypothetical protein SAMN06269185_3314 [Natronoarchaeum philippinense]
MSAEDFLLEAAAEDGVSVGREDDQLVVRCTDHTEERIDTEVVHDLAHEHGMIVERTVSDFDAGAVDVVIPIHRGEADGE